MIAELLSDDEFGQDREGAGLERYEAAYDTVVRNRSNYLESSSTVPTWLSRQCN